MKILQIIQRPQFRGAEIFACQLSEELIKQGHQVDVLFLFGDSNKKLPFNVNFLHLKGKEKNRWWDFSAYKRLAKLIRNNNYDIVQANAGDTLKYAALAKKIFGFKSKLVFRNANKISDFLNSKSKLIINRWLAKEIDFVASVSELCKQDFQKLFPISNDCIASLPIGINTNVPEPYKNFTELGLPEFNGPVFLHVGSFVPEKNHKGLIQIFSQVQSKYSNAHLLLIGSGRLEDETKQLVNQLGLESSIHFLGTRKDVLKLMPLCTALLMPSHIEGLPGVILEAMVSKIPVIANNVGGIGEVIINNKTGWLTEKNNPEEFVEVVMNLLSRNNIDDIKSNAYELVTTDYNNTFIAKKFMNHYNKFIK